jgi:hypothetical protein
MNIQNNDFICPHCRGHLRPSDKIIFSVKTRSGSSGMLLLSPYLGEYNIEKHYNFKLTQGEHLDIYCPICHENLSSPDEHINLAKVIMVDNEGKEYDIIFSKIVGEKCTYLIHGEEVESYGPDAPEYFNYWGEKPNY